MRLEGQVAINTGGAAGLGLACTRRFLEEGARVLIADIADPAAAAGELECSGLPLALPSPPSGGEGIELPLPHRGRGPG